MYIELLFNFELFLVDTNEVKLSKNEDHGHAHMHKFEACDKRFNHIFNFALNGK